MSEPDQTKEASEQCSDAAGCHVKYDPEDIRYFGAQAVIERELGYIRRRRGIAADAAIDNLSGLALSGGGIRSASFSLGVMQALAHNGWLKNFDYLSTVSGGGYIGSSISWLLTQPLDKAETGIERFGLDRENFPYGSYPMSGADPDLRMSAKTADGNPEGQDGSHGVTERYKGKLLRYLRQQAKYLTPGDGINALSLVAVVLRGALVSLSVYFGLLLAIFIAVAYPLVSHTLPNLGLSIEKGNLALLLALAVGGIVVFLSLAYALATNALSKRKQETQDEQDDGEKSPAYCWRQCYERSAGRLLGLALALLTLGAVPAVYDALQQALGKDHATWVGGLSALFGALSGVFAFFKSSSGKKGRLPMGLVVAVATAALWFGLLLIAYHFGSWLWQGHGGGFIATVWAAIVAIVYVLGRASNINYLAIHRYYRDRLMEAFMPDVGKALAGEIATRAAGGADKMPIHKLIAKNSGEAPPAHLAPYHLINTNVVLEASSIPKFRGRGGDNFILSPYYCGSNATGWCDAEHFMDGRMTLPTAMAISGAAVNPSAGVGGQGVTRQPLLSMLMALLNIRLGYWAPNPDPDPKKKEKGKNAAGTETQTNPGNKTREIPNYLFPGLCEIFLRRQLNEEADYVQLTDGGHFENLALYELIRRRARLIVLCDGAADPDFQFTDLANAIEKVRVDFGTLILCDCEDLQPLVPRAKTTQASPDDAIHCADRGYLMSTIIYPDNSQGRLLYIKTTFFEQLGADLYGYKKTHPQFPDEPTSDQFFDEKQFEAYRELGFQTAWRMMQDEDIRDDAFVRMLWTSIDSA